MGQNSVTERSLGTMVTYGYPEIAFRDELCIAMKIVTTVLEILPDWGRLPDPAAGSQAVGRRGSIDSQRPRVLGWANDPCRCVDLGTTESSTHQESVDDLRLCVDWLAAAGGRCLVVHPGGLSDPEECERASALARGGTVDASRAYARNGRRCLCREHAPRRPSRQSNG